MEYAYVRDVATGTYVWNIPVVFQRLPCVNEFIWINNQAYSVQAVHHNWDAAGQPICTIDIGIPKIHNTSMLVKTE